MSYEPEENAVPLEIVGNGALEALSKAEIDTQIATAKRYPRNIPAVKSQMMSIATLDEETAQACFYTLPRGGKNIQGPSVRMAEIALSSYGNVKAATRILSVDTNSAAPHAVVQAVVIDLEKNVAFSVEKRRRIVGKKKNGGKPDEDDVNLAVNAGSAIAFRDAVFKVVPGALVKAVYEAAKKVAVGDLKSLATQREKVLGRLKQMGAAEDRIFAVLGIKKADEITLDHIETLIGIGTALRDGNVTLEEAFPAPASEQSGRPIFTSPKPAGAATTEPPKTQEPEDQIPGAEVPPVAAVASFQDELASFVVGSGVTVERFVEWYVAEGYEPQGLTSFAEVPEAVAKKLLRSKTGLVAALKGGAK